MTEPTFAQWLCLKALAAGYDTEGRGGRAKLAKATGISPTQIGRTLDGVTKPDIRSMVLLSRALGVPLPEMLIRSGDAEPSDFPDQPASPSAPDVHEAAQAWGLNAEDARILHILVESLQKRSARQAQQPAE